MLGALRIDGAISQVLDCTSRDALPSPMAVEATAWREYTVVLNSIGIKPATDVPDWRIRAKS